MKNNTITLKGKNGKKTTYKVLLAVEEESVMENLILYTSTLEAKNDKKNVYAIKIDMNGKYKKVNKKEFEFLSGMLNNLQNERKKDDKEKIKC